MDEEDQLEIEPPFYFIDGTLWHESFYDEWIGYKYSLN